MATLVQFLAAGVKGAESGTATFLLRGTASSAASVLYNDFEQTTQPGTNVVVLDSNGAAEIYTDAYVDVVLRNSGGSTLRTVTLGHSAPLVEVRSTSFLGSDYDGDPSNTAGQPTTLKAILDKWLASAGATDWRVLINGSPVNMTSAFAAFGGMFINVKDPQYGAVGDGVSNDTVAVSNAVAAANTAGGVVVFPPGVYLVSNITVAAANIALVGFGQATVSLSSGTAFTFTDTTLTGIKLIEGLKFQVSSSATRFLDFTTGGQNATVRGCTFDTDGLTLGSIGFDGTGGTYSIEGCHFVLGTTETQASIRHEGGVNKNVRVSSCFFSLPVAYANTCIEGSCFNISDCVFDGSLVTTGAFVCIDPGDVTDTDFFWGIVSRCEFLSGDSSVIQCISLDNVGESSYFVESNNVFYDANDLYGYGNNASLDDSVVISLGSRLGRQITLDNATFPTLSPQALLAHSKFIVNHTNASNLTLTFTGNQRPPGLEWDAVVLNNSGGARDVTFAGTGQSVTIAAVPDGGRATARFFTYVETAGTTVAVGITGTLTGAT